MKVEYLKLTNYRNYQSVEVDFCSGVNFVVGKNAQGKTNLVEPLYLLSVFKSFRNSKLVDCIKEGEASAEIFARVNYDGNFKKNLKLIINRDGANELYVNENKISQKKDMYGYLYSVIFSPDELKLVKGGPEVRREFLDTDISQVSKVYAELVMRYDELLASRNKLLKFGTNTENTNLQLDVYEEQMSIVGSQITLARQNFVSKLSKNAEKVMQYLSRQTETLSIVYCGVVGETRQEKTENLRRILHANREKDKMVGFTTVGPHRDDIKMFINGKEVKPFASQGQQRSVVLSLKIAELDTIKQEKETPILLLDDVFSELDSARQKLLIEYLKDSQVFVTSTTFKNPKAETMQKFRVKNGAITPEK